MAGGCPPSVFSGALINAGLLDVLLPMREGMKVCVFSSVWGKVGDVIGGYFRRYQRREVKTEEKRRLLVCAALASSCCPYSSFFFPLTSLHFSPYNPSDGRIFIAKEWEHKEVETFYTLE